VLLEKAITGCLDDEVAEIVSLGHTLERSAPETRSFRMRYSGPSLRPRCPVISFCTRRRTASTQRLATRTTLKGHSCGGRGRAHARPVVLGEVGGHDLDDLQPLG